jgi:hypothetical protein
MQSPGKFKRKLIKQIRIAPFFFFLGGGRGSEKGGESFFSLFKMREGEKQPQAQSGKCINKYIRRL